MREPGNARSRLLAGLAVAIVTLAAMWPVLGNGFVNYDDNEYVSENPHVRNGPTLASLKWALATGHAGNWHPLTWLSHMGDVGLHGLEPRGHHLTSLVLHVANAVLLFLLLGEATGSRARSAVAATLWGVHPLRVEAVAWVSERKELLAVFLGFLAALAYLRYARRRTALRMLPVAALLALGLMAKPMLVTLPLLLLVLDFWPLARGDSLRSRLVEKIPLFVLSAASGIVTLLVQRAGGAMGNVEQYPLSLRVANAVVSCADYLAATVWPRGLAVFYPYPAAGIPAWKVAGAAFLLAAATALAVRLRRRVPYLLAGWLFCLIALLPVIGLVQVGEQARADRYTYLPLAGILVAAAWGAPDLAAALARLAGGRGEAERRARAWLLVPAAAAVIGLAVLSRAQAATWRDSATLFSHALAATGPNHVAHLNLGLALESAGSSADAIPHYEEAVRIQPDHAIARNALGLALSRTGRMDEAILHLERAAAIAPRYPAALSNLGTALARSGRMDEALARFAAAALVLPDDSRLRYNWGTALAAAGRFEEAAARFEDAIRLDPGNAQAHYNLGATLMRLGQMDRGRAEIEAARRLGFSPPS